MSKNLTLNSALNVPKLSCRLLFVSKLTKYMNDIANFFHSQCEVQNQYSGRTISNAREVDGLYYFEGDAIESGQAQVGSSSDISLFGGDQIMLWLFRLGHPSFSYLKQLFPSLFKNKNPFFFYRQKHKDILEKGSLKGNPEHTGSIQETPKTSNKNTSTHRPSTRTQPIHNVKQR